MNEYGVATGPRSIRFERILPGPIERVWAYLTDSEKRGQWLAGGPMELRVGGAVALAWRASELTSEPTPEKYKGIDQHRLKGEIRECVPPRLLTYSWPEGPGNESEVSFELTPREGEVLLVLIHRNLPSRDELVGVGGGWHLHLGILEDLLRGVEPRPFWANHLPLEAEYAKRLPAE